MSKLRFADPARAKAWVRQRSTLPRDVIVLGLIAFCVMLGFGVVIPVLPVFARSFGVGNFEVGMVVSVFALMRLIISPFTARMINWWGERVVLASGIYIVAASSAVSGLAANYEQLLIMRGVGGIGSAMFTVSAMTLLLNSVDSKRRGRAQSFFQGGFLLGGMAGPALGGLLSKISLTAPFFFYAATLAVAGTIGLLLLNPPGDRTAKTDAAPARPFREVLRDSRYQAALVANFAQGWNSFGVRSALIPVLVVEGLRREPTWTGIAFAIAAVAQAIALAPAGKFVDTVGRKQAIILGSGLSAASMVAIAFVPNIWVLIAVLCVYAVGASMLGTAPASSVGDAAGARSGTPVAVFSMTSDVGAIIGPLVAGFLADEVSMPVAFLTGAILLGVAMLVSLRMPGGVPGVDGAPPPVSSPGSEEKPTPNVTEEPTDDTQAAR